MKKAMAMYEANIDFGCTTGENYSFTARKEYPADHEDDQRVLFREYVEAEFNKECKRLFGSKTVPFSADLTYIRDGEWLDSEEFSATYNGEKVVVEECIPF